MDKADELSALWARYKGTGDQDAQEQLVEYYLPLVKHLAVRILRKLRTGTDLDELVADGMFGLLRAVEGFELSRGYKFETYAIPVIRGAIYNGLRRMDWLPERMRGRARALQKAIDHLSAISGRQPTETELAEELKVSSCEVFDMISSLGCIYLLSLDQPVSAGDENDATIMDLVGDQEYCDPSRELEFSEQRANLREAVAKLNDREQTLIRMHYFEGVTFDKIAGMFGVSKQRVSQMHSRAVRRLRELLGDNVVEIEAIHSFLIEG